MKQKTAVIIILGLLAIAYLGWLGQVGLRAEEPRRAMVSIEMMENGDYILPHLIGWPYYNKPPLFNWVMILFFKVFGNTSEWIVRLPSMLSLLLMAFLSWKWNKKHLTPPVALLSAFMLLTSADLLFYGSVNTGEIDLFFSLLVMANLYVIYLCLDEKKYLNLFLWSYFFAALGFLTKGLPAITFHGFTLLMALIFFKKIRLLFHWKHAAGLALFVFIAGGYIYLLYLRGEHTGFIARQFKEASQRTGLDSSIVNTLLGIFNSPLIFLKLMLPWSLLILLFLQRKTRTALRKNHFVMFSLLVLAVNFPIYWITGELRGRYIYPLVPFAVVVLAYTYQVSLRSWPRFNRIVHIFTLAAVYILPLSMLIALFLPTLSFENPTRIAIYLLLAASLFLPYLLHRKRLNNLYLLILVMALSRIGMNLTFMDLAEPESQTTLLRNHVADILSDSGSETLGMTGTPHTYDSQLQLLGVELFNNKIKVAPIISYQVPYYYYQSSGRIIKYTPRPVAGKNYLLIKKDWPDYPGETRYEFLDQAAKNYWRVIQYKPGLKQVRSESR